MSEIKSLGWTVGDLVQSISDFSHFRLGLTDTSASLLRDEIRYILYGLYSQYYFALRKGNKVLDLEEVFNSL